MIREAISKLIEKKDLTPQEMEKVTEEIMTGQALPSQIASFLTALRMKGETLQEITTAAQVMRKFVVRINVEKDVILDTCGTGGDGSHTFNISTISAFVVSGVGVTVAKHGNRSVSSRCGSADLLEGLGVNLNMSKEKIEECIERIGIGFLFAPNLHPAMKYATPVRREIGIRTIFNLLGPLANPAFATHQLLGVYDPNLLEVFTSVLKNLGLKHAMVVYGLDGLDEVTTTQDTLVSELKDGKILSYKISPLDYGFKKVNREDLLGGDLEENIRIAKDILEGKPGPKRDIVLFNSGVALYTADKTKDIKEGIERAKESIDSKKALEKLELLKGFSKNSG